MINMFFKMVKRKKKVNPLIRELIDFTNILDPKSFKIMDLILELDKFKPSEADLDALEDAFLNRKNWAPLNNDYWEEIIIEILKKNGRDIQ